MGNGCRRINQSPLCILCDFYGVFSFCTSTSDLSFESLDKSLLESGIAFDRGVDKNGSKIGQDYFLLRSLPVRTTSCLNSFVYCVYMYPVCTMYHGFQRCMVCTGPDSCGPCSYTTWVTASLTRSVLVQTAVAHIRIQRGSQLA